MRKQSCSRAESLKSAAQEVVLDPTSTMIFFIGLRPSWHWTPSSFVVVRRASDLLLTSPASRSSIPYAADHPPSSAPAFHGGCDL